MYLLINFIAWLDEAASHLGLPRLTESEPTRSDAAGHIDPEATFS